jgi:hypothetical protein
MKKVFLLLLLLTTITFAQESFNTNLHMRDTLVTKSVNVQQDNFWSMLKIIFPYVISLGGLLIAFYTIKNQKEISQAQITVNHIEKRIDGLMEISKNIDKNIFNLFTVKDILKKELKNNHELKIKYSEYIGEELSENRMTAFNNIQSSNSIIDSHDKVILSYVNELLYWTHLMTLYVPQNTNQYEIIKSLSKDLTKYINDYYNFIKDRKITNTTEDAEKINLFEAKANEVLDKLETNINTERDNINTIIIKKTIS